MVQIHVGEDRDRWRALAMELDKTDAESDCGFLVLLFIHSRRVQHAISDFRRGLKDLHSSVILRSVDW